MKKYFSIILITVVTLMTVNAQAQDKIRSYIGLYGGMSFATSDFGKSDYNNNQAGFAKRGSTFSLDGAYYIYKNHLAIGYTLGWQDNGELTTADATALAVGYTNSYKSNGTTVSGVNRYHNYNILIGPQYSFQVHQFIIDIRASAGVIKSNSTPETDVYLADVPTQPDLITQHSSKYTAFGYSGNLGVRYVFAPNWYIGLKGSYLASPGIKISTTGFDQKVIIGRNVTKQPINTIQTVFGITHSF